MSLKNTHAPTALKDTPGHRRIKKESKRLSSRKTRRVAKAALIGSR